MRRGPPASVDPCLAALYASRGRLHASRYLHTGDRHDLEDAILNMRKAAVLAEDVHSGITGQAMRSLAALLLEDYKSNGRDTALNEALQLSMLALNCSTVDASDNALMFAIHGSLLASRYDISNKPRDLEDAISSLQLAIETRNVPQDGQLPAIASHNLACVLSMRYHNTGRRGDLCDAIKSALIAAGNGLSNYPSLIARAGSNLATLLAREYESTGQLDSVSSALFELRIVAEIAPEFSEFDTILSHLGRLANEQHALRAQLSTDKLEISKGDFSKYLKSLIVLSLIPVFSIVFRGSFYPLAAFLGGFLSNMALEKYDLQHDSGDSFGYPFHIASWIRKMQYHPSKFTPTLISTLWINVSSTATSTGPDQKWYNGEIPSIKEPVHTMRFGSEYDGRQRTLEVPPRRRNRIQDDDEASRTVNQIPRTLTFVPSPPLGASSGIKCDEHELEAQKENTCNPIAESRLGDYIFHSQYDFQRRKTPRSTSEAGEHVDRIHQVKEYIPSITPETASSSGDSESTEITYFAEVSQASELQEMASTAFPVSLELPPPIPVQNHGPHKHDTPSPASEPVKARANALASPKAIPPSEKDMELEKNHQSIRKEFRDQNVPDHSPPTKTVHDSSTFESVAQGNTSNEINRNDGNAMGNIYSEEAHVIGHLSRHYGDKHETKNISALIRGGEKAGAHESLSGSTPDRLHSGDIPQDLLDQYINDLKAQTTEEDRKHQEIAVGERIPISKVGFDADIWQAPPFSDSSNTSHASNQAVSGRRFWRRKEDDTQPDGERDLDRRTSRTMPLRPSLFSGKGTSRTESAIPDNRRLRISSKQTSRHRRPTAHFSDESWSETEFEVVRPKLSPDRHGLQHKDDKIIHVPSPPPLPHGHSSREPEIKSSSQQNETLGYIRPVRDRTTQPPTRKPARMKRLRASKSAASISMPPPAPDLRTLANPLAQIVALESYFESAILPVCNDVISNPPSDTKKRDYAYKALSETILAQVIMNADGVDVQDPVTRATRRRLVKTAHTTLENLDAAREKWNL